MVECGTGFEPHLEHDILTPHITDKVTLKQ